MRSASIVVSVKMRTSPSVQQGTNCTYLILRLCLFSASHFSPSRSNFYFEDLTVRLLRGGVTDFTISLSLTRVAFVWCWRGST
jgi:hypothetical protein